MLKFKNIRFTYLLSFAIIFVLLMMSCEAPRSGKYRSRRPTGSSSYYNRSSSNRMRARRNVIPISKNYRIKNKRTSGNY
ncbi:MAG: hypothetical protein HXX18_06730 [Bacteroidetes bacterium]|nr:hypothetical protein [Bacteroidota bacterium]